MYGRYRKTVAELTEFFELPEVQAMGCRLQAVGYGLRCTDMCTGMCTGMCTDRCTGMCPDMCTDMCTVQMFACMAIKQRQLPRG